MPSGEADSMWSQKGATLSDKSARKEFGLTQEEIIQAIKDGKLQYRLNSIFGNPFLRLVRSEVEALVDEKYGNFSISPGNFIETKPQRIEKQGITFLNSLICPDLLRSYVPDSSAIRFGLIPHLMSTSLSLEMPGVDIEEP